MLPTLKRLSLVFIIILSLAFFGYLVYTGMGAKTKASVSTNVAGNGEIPTSTDGLVAQWNFNETNGTIAQSGGSCGKSCDGQLVNFAYNGSQDAALGTGWTTKNKLWGMGALMFDGVNDYVSVNSGAGSQLDIDTDPITLEAWVTPGEISGVRRILFRGIPGKQGYGLSIGVNGAAKFNVGNAGGGNFDGTTIIQKGVWYHVVGIINGGNSMLYVNGKLDATGSVGTVASDERFSIGAGWNGTAYQEFWNGVIDSSRVYNRALSEKEIVANFQARNGDRLCGKEVCPVGYACYQPPPPPLLPCEAGKPCPVYDQLPPSCRPITTPTPPQSLTATPIPNGTPNASSFLFKVRMPDVSQSVGTVKDVRVLITDKPGTLYDFKVDLQRVQGTDFFIANPIELDIPDGSYIFNIKQAKSLSRSFTAHLSKGKTLDCTQNNPNVDCQSLGKPELAPLYSGDSDGLVDTKTNNGVRANSYNVVDSADLQRVVAGYGLSPLPPEPNGDFNLDGKIDVQDLGILGKNFGKRGD